MQCGALLLVAWLFPPESSAAATRQRGLLEEAYDYVVVGGGLSGLVVANRLSEDASGGPTFPCRDSQREQEEERN